MLHPFASERFSPMSFDGQHVVSGVHVDLLLDAARRAPSAGNSQPWSFIVGRRGDVVHERLVRHLARSSSAWAPSASVLVANIAHRYVEDTTMEHSEFALYDLGQAVAHLTFQAHALGLAAHQFRAFDRDAVQREFAVPGHWQVVSMVAVGRAADGADDVVGAGTSRERRAVADVVWARA